MERLGVFESKLCYVVCRGTEILGKLEVPVKIRTDWQAYLSDPTAGQRRQSKKEINFLKKMARSAGL